MKSGLKALKPNVKITVEIELQSLTRRKAGKTSGTNQKNLDCEIETRRLMSMPTCIIMRTNQKNLDCEIERTDDQVIGYLL